MKALLRKIRQILRDRKTRRIFTRLVSTVAAIVVFVTTYALVLPAITMESEASCGIEAHQHDQSCYTDVLVCELLESPGHVHDESCYGTKQKQVCQIEEHAHDSDCYDGNGKLICEKDEHQHGEDCFEEVRELVCEIPESPGHQHDDSCYQKVLTCGKEVHTHSAACYHADTASQAATEAIAVASTESAAAAATGNGLVDNLNAPAEYSESETSLDSSIENNVIEGNLDALPDNTEPGSDSTSLTNEGDKDEPGAWTSTEATADATAATAASTGSGAGVTGSTAAATGSSTGGTAATAAPAGATDTMSAAAGYVLVLDELNFDTLLNKHTGIYYSRLAGSDSAVDNEIDGTDATADTGGTQEEAAAANTGETQAKESDLGTNSGEKQEEAVAENTGELQEVATWNRIDKHTELKESDNLRLYLAYTIPAGSLNETNQTARYSLSKNIHLTDEQVDEINATVNGIARQYVSYDTLEILDQEMYGKYLGIEAVEGTRTPADDLDEYLANNEGQEFISATVKVENVFDENTGLLKAQDLVFTFAPYTIQKNQHQYDSEGQPIKAGEEVNGWLAIDISTEQIDWEKADDETKTADIIFVEKDKKSDLKEISTELRLVEAEVDSDTDTNVGNAAKGVGPDVAATDNKQDGTKDSETAAGESDKAEKEPVSYPSVSFDDSITVVGGALSTDTDEASGDAGMAAETEITVHVEADKDTFPEGTTMVLSTVSDDQMTAVAEAVEGAVDAPKTMGFHAVDISFRDVKGNEIEPLKPIRVSMTSDAIRRAVQDESTAPVVVHVSDPSGEQDAADENMDDGGSTDTADADEAEGADSQYIVDSSESTEEQVPGSNLETTPSVNIIETDTGTKENNGDTLIFEAEAFSVYAIVYTVDFHYEINGKMYDFSIPGGGFVSLEHVVEVLGIATADENGENGAENAENGAENGNDFVEEVSGVDVSGENSTAYEQAIKLNEVEVSEVTKKFVADVESVEFSSPELVWVRKVESESTVGGLKEAYGLDVEYSAELTEEQIAEINAQTVEAGDWALISVQPFTSEETLTVTMKNGDQFVVKVTDAQRIYKSVDDVVTGDYLIYSTSSETDSNSGVKYTVYRFLKNDGTTVIKNTRYDQYISTSELADYTWHFTKINNNVFTIKSTKSNLYLTLPGNNSSTNLTSNSSANMKLIQVTNSEGYDSNIKIYNYNETKWINWSGSSGFIVSTSGSASLNLYKIESTPSGGGAQGIILSQEEKDELDSWKETLERFDTLTSKGKTAEVFDYDNRMYKIDITADSGITDFYKDVDLGFVLDVSNSMNFPASLSGLRQAWMSAWDLDNAKSQYSQYYAIDNCFYIISDPALTSTIYKVFKDGSQWKWQDASVTDGTGIYNLNDGTLFKEPYRQQYTLYYADDTNNRFYYLKNSVNNAITTLNRIVTPTEHVDDETASVSIAYNLFAKEIKQSAAFVDLRTRLNDFVLEWSSTDSGTRQNVALYDAANNTNNGLSANEFGWDTDNETDKYVILVTDGAPNGPTIDDVKTAAQNLKDANPGLKIITVGLSTQDVDGGSQMLSEIADSIDNVKQFYEAETANDLEYIMLRILRTIMAKGLVQGKIADTIDDAFYPVDINGNPITEGTYNTNGQRIGDVSAYVSNGSPNSSHSNDIFYTWEIVDGNWKITWYNQEIGWDDNDTTTGQKWRGTVYVKTKEDYLGGNLIETNDRATFQATGIKLVKNGSPEEDWRPLAGLPELLYPVPRVNVHNLETKDNSSTWTVYKGTSITPKEQLEALWNAIPIEEVVSASENGQHKRTTGASANVGTAGAGETFTLGSLMSEVAPSFNIDSLIDQITASNSSASQEFTYSAYGHESGKITVKVERTVGDQTPATHTANTIGTPTEQYKVTFTYKPYTEAERKARLIQANELDDEGKNNNNYHNGSNSRGAEETGTLTSTNTHTINVFQKGIKVTKVDATNNDLTLSGAVFELFQVDSNGSVNGSDYGLPSGSYTKVGGDLTADSNGVITINPVIPDQDPSVTNKTLYEPNINVGETTETSHDTELYLVEKTPPTKDGVTYAKMPGAIKFTMTLSEDKGNDSTATLYNWTQTAVISVQEHGNGTTEYLINDAANTTIGTNSDVYAYKLKNGRATDITLIKVDKVTQNSIGGAKFSLLKGSENVDLTKLIITAISGGAAVTPEDYDFNGTTIKVVTVPEGGIRIAGLTDDTYTLREVSAPAGYVITDSGKVFKTENGAIKNTDDSAHQNEATDIAFEVENEPGAALPNTGGPGTRLYTILGSILILGAGVLLWRRRRLI